MKYFPAFIKLDNKKTVIIGGGHIAFEKLEKLLQFTTDITVISKDISNSMQELCAKYQIPFTIKNYEKGDVNGYDIVIIAVDSLELQKDIFEETRSSRILCNAVDSVDYCDFIFPSFIKEGDLTIAVSTSGASPAMAKYLRRYIQKILPSNISDFLKEMKSLRDSLPKGKERMKLLDKKVKEFFRLD